MKYTFIMLKDTEFTEKSSNQLLEVPNDNEQELYLFQKSTNCGNPEAYVPIQNGSFNELILLQKPQKEVSFEEYHDFLQMFLDEFD